MATRKKNRDVPFFVTLDDGSEHSITIDPFVLRNGDHIARIVAGEWQRDGKIPPGKIVKVRRAPQ